MTWWRVRKEKARIDALRAAERAERERRAAASPRRNMPSQFRKGEYGPPLATMSATKPEAPSDDSASKRSEAFSFRPRKASLSRRLGGSSNSRKEERTSSLKRTARSSEARTGRPPCAANSRLNNVTGRRPINDGTAEMYARLGLRSENL